MKSFRQRISLCGTLLAMFVAVNYVLLETTAHAPVAPASPWSQYLTPTTVRWVSIAVLVGTLGVVGYLYLLAGWLRGDVRRLRTGIKGLARHGDKSEIADPAYAEITECAAELTGLADWLRTEQGRLTDDATRDPLTGLPNRRFLSETLSREIAAAMRTHWPLSLIMVDLDHFKSLNDTYGHQAGDVVLKR
ncbi:MAG: diguanylate cyclase, partial [Planctomycetes bacterium]|nr:diguanylate cyclase [Planctomycetota bacterium]